MATTTDAHAVDALERAHREVNAAREAVDLDRAELDAVVEAYEAVSRVLERWEERATDWDDFKGYVEFRNDLADTLESIPEDVPERDAFVEADRHVKTSGVSKSLKRRDFDAARDALKPARAYAERKERWLDARESYRDAYRAARRRRTELDDRIDELERLSRLADVDLDAPIDELHDPVERYNEAVRAAFTAFRRDESARDVLGFVADAASRPLIGYEAPPGELLSYVTDDPAGDHPVDDLVSFADYSPSKLSHYVDDSNLLKRRVATNRTYLERLGPEPLCVEWPPAPAAELRYRTDDLVSLVSRFADEETVVALRAVRALTRRDDYERLRTAATARDELSTDERKRIKDGRVDDELAATGEERDALVEALETHPAPAELSL